MAIVSRVLDAMQPLRRPRLWLGLWLGMIAGVVVVSLIPPPLLPAVAFDGIDKVEHVLGYFALSAMGSALFARMRTRARIAAGLVALGIGLEIAQGQFTAMRQPELLDAAANTVGVLLGCLGTIWAGALQRVDRRLARALGGTMPKP